MRGELSTETAVEAPASEVWAAYRGVELGRLVTELMGDSLGRADVLSGDGTPGVGYMTEKFTKVDEEKRFKETETVEGGFIAMGFDLYRVRLEILEKGAESSIIKSTIEYEVDDSKSELVSYVSTDPIELMAKTIGNHVVQTRNTPPPASA
ncbi:Norbelladine synthase [Linum perenne]